MTRFSNQLRFDPASKRHHPPNTDLDRLAQLTVEGRNAYYIWTHVMDVRPRRGDWVDAFFYGFGSSPARFKILPQLAPRNGNE